MTDEQIRQALNELVTVTEAAKIAGVTRTSIEMAILRGNIQAYEIMNEDGTIPSIKLVTRDSVQAYKDKREGR
ncbi:MAG: hypothetical protein Q4E22_03225 [Coriobacteriia bacterium]|nr:hypothetical protein [Coriobacteriia bacterium]